VREIQIVCVSKRVIEILCMRVFQMRERESERKRESERIMS